MADWLHGKHAGEGSESGREHKQHETPATAHHEDATAGQHGNHGRNTLHAGQSVGSGENPNYLVGTGGAQLVVQADGDLVLYRGARHAKDEIAWHSDTAHKGHGARRGSGRGSRGSSGGGDWRRFPEGASPLPRGPAARRAGAEWCRRPESLICASFARGRGRRSHFMREHSRVRAHA